MEKKPIDNLVVCLGKGGQKDQAVALAKHIGVPLTDTPGEELTLLVDKEGVTLTGFGLSFRGDFEGMLHRITDGRLQHEMLAHVAKTTVEHPRAVDATAGMGEDAFLLAASGYEVTLYEQNPVVAALVKDALRRGKKHPIIKPIVERMNFVESNSIEEIPKLPYDPDVIYLDPMFPARQKSGLIGKKLQLIQKLEQPCFEEEALLSMALSVRPQKIIIKRPLKGANLADKQPHYSVKGKAIRYDCFVFPKD